MVENFCDQNTAISNQTPAGGVRHLRNRTLWVGEGLKPAPTPELQEPLCLC
jgi:hypothetical protein